MQRMIRDTQRRDDAAARREATRAALREIWTPRPPWPNFADDVRNTIASLFVVRLAKRRGRGAAHDGTIRRIDPKSGRILQRIPLENVTKAVLERLVDKAGRNRTLYEQLKIKLDAADGKPEKAFPPATTLFRIGLDGETRQAVRAITVETDIKSGLTLPTPRSIASNGDMIRVDVFEYNGKYFLVPIYVHHLGGKNSAPLAAITKGLKEDRWPQVSESHKFKFSLWPDDYVILEKVNNQLIEGYYRSTHRGDGRIYLASHLTRSVQYDPATKTARTIRKYQVDRLGNKFEIKREPRLWRGGISI
jgi:CRISPR-associated endonuclease Csn1